MKRIVQSAVEDAPGAKLFQPWDWLFAAALVVAVFLVYKPAWQGGFILDDDSYIIRPELRSLHGLGRIWFDLRATAAEQYYPLLHSAFWLEHKLWGDAALGYHLVNIALHAIAAILVLLILLRLKVPGAYLAAAIFALHPVQVESVAWITEQKNTLSAAFYLGAMLSYLQFDRRRGKSWYVFALLLFVLALLSKTMTATLPAALLVIFWWQRGRLSWKKDVLPLLPFFLIGLAGACSPHGSNGTMCGAEGDAFTFSLVERGLIAGRAVWFYLGKLFWPADLVFIYPRWHVSQGVWWQYLFPLAAVRCCGVVEATPPHACPLAAALFFVGTLFPVLGFLNVALFVYSFVADHFQYLACLGVIALFSAGVALLLKRAAGWGKLIGQMGCVALVAVLAVLSWRQSRMYADAETLYRTTIDRNPDCWMAHNNLGVVLAGRGQVDEAIAHYRKALEIKPDYAEAHIQPRHRPGRPRTGRRGHRPLPEGPGNQARLRRGPLQPRRRLGRPRTGSTRPSPITRRPWKSSPTTPRPTTTSASLWPAAGRSTRPSPITARPWKSSPTTRRPTTTSASPWPAADRSTRPSPITRRPWKSNPTTRRPTTTSALLCQGAARSIEAIVPIPEGPGNQTRPRGGPQQSRHRPGRTGPG